MTTIMPIAAIWREGKLPIRPNNYLAVTKSDIDDNATSFYTHRVDACFGNIDSTFLQLKLQPITQPITHYVPEYLTIRKHGAACFDLFSESQSYICACCQGVFNSVVDVPEADGGVLYCSKGCQEAKTAV